MLRGQTTSSNHRKSDKRSLAHEVNQSLGARPIQSEVENTILNGDTRQYGRNDPMIRSDRSRDSIANPNLSIRDFHQRIQRLSQQLGGHESLHSNDQRQAINQVTIAMQRTSFWLASSENSFESDTHIRESHTFQEHTSYVAETVNRLLSLRNSLFSPTPQIPDIIWSHLSVPSSSEEFLRANAIFRSIDDGMQPPCHRQSVEICGVAGQREPLIIALPDNLDDEKERFLEFVIMQTNGEKGIEHLTCPITYGIYQEPIEASDGRIYEKTHLLAYIQREEGLHPNKQLTSPFRVQMTRKLTHRPDITKEINEFIYAINEGQYDDLVQEFHQNCQSEYMPVCK